MLERLVWKEGMAEAAAEVYDAYLSGGGDVRPSGTEALKDDADGTSLFLEACDGMGSAENAGSKASAMYNYAMARDAKYAMAGRNFLKALGYHNGYRGMYETAKHIEPA